MGIIYNPIADEFQFVRSSGGGGSGLATKSGTVPGASFSGSPKKFTVAFATPFPDDNYSIALGSEANRQPIYEAKTDAGFTINAQANTAFTEQISWIATANGETA